MRRHGGARTCERPGSDERNALFSWHAGSVQKISLTISRVATRWVNFYDSFPSITREMAVQTIKESKHSLIARIA